MGWRLSVVKFIDTVIRKVLFLKLCLVINNRFHLFHTALSLHESRSLVDTDDDLAMMGGPKRTTVLKSCRLRAHSS